MDDLREAIINSIGAQKSAQSTNQKSFTGSGVLSFWTDDFYSDLLTEYSQKDLEEFIAQMMILSAENIGDEWSEVPSDFDDEMSDLIEKSTDKIRESDATLKESIKTLIDENKNASADELTAIINDKFSNVYSESRAKTIARTTATYATSAAQTTVWTKSGWTPQWLSSRNSSVRKTHREADGQTPDKNGYYHVGKGKGKHPGDIDKPEESVNCNCTQVPVKK
jgi:DNA-binding protein H-NS